LRHFARPPEREGRSEITMSFRKKKWNNNIIAKVRGISEDTKIIENNPLNLCYTIQFSISRILIPISIELIQNFWYMTKVINVFFLRKRSYCESDLPRL